MTSSDRITAIKNGAKINIEAPFYYEKIRQNNKCNRPFTCKRQFDFSNLFQLLFHLVFAKV